MNLKLKLKLKQAALKARRALLHGGRPKELDFLCIGPAFSGEEWVYHQLNNHRDVIVPYMTTAEFYSTSLKPFLSRVPGYMVGAVDTAWFAAKRWAVQDLQAQFPHLKIVVLIRNLRSRWLEATRYQIATMFDMDATRFAMGRGVYASDMLKFMTTMNDRERFPPLATTLPMWQDIFGHEQVHVVMYDRTVTHPNSTRYSLCQFLDINPEGFEVESSKRRTMPKCTQYGYFPRSIGSWVADNYESDRQWIKQRFSYTA